jgi:hypothetical protein
LEVSLALRVLGFPSALAHMSGHNVRHMIRRRREATTITNHSKAARLSNNNPRISLFRYQRIRSHLVQALKLSAELTQAPHSTCYRVALSKRPKEQRHKVSVKTGHAGAIHPHQTENEPRLHVVCLVAGVCRRGKIHTLLIPDEVRTVLRVKIKAQTSTKLEVSRKIVDSQKAISLSVADISVGIDNPRYDRDSKKNCCRPDQ